jgi:hypothetical protein
VPSVLATVVAQVAGGVVEVAEGAAAVTGGEPEEETFAERDALALCVAAAEPQPASSPRVVVKSASNRRAWPREVGIDWPCDGVLTSQIVKRARL